MSEYLETIENLNAELFDEFKEPLYEFEYSTNGYCHIISFNGTQLWSSELDDREWIEEKNDYEPFEPYIRRVFNEYADRIYSLKFKDNN